MSIKEIDSKNEDQRINF